RLLVNQRVGKFFLGNNPVNKLPFLYLTLKLSNVMNDIINRGQGSAQPNISPSDIEAIEITIPHDDILDDFNCKMKPIFKSLTHFTVENQNLERLRDALLPKLMSGELKINDLNS
ncbi:MAG: restriction endonuclease subunit S, partial [Anaerovoracaceae bacterium]